MRSQCRCKQRQSATRATPVSASDHCSCCLALGPVQLERGRAADAGPWRAVDKHGVVIEKILKSRRDKRAAKRFLVKLMKRWGFVPKRIIAPSRDIAPQCASCVLVGQWTSCDPTAPQGAMSRPALIIGPTRGSTTALKQPSAISKTRANTSGLPVTGRPSAFRLHAVRNPQSFLCPSPPTLRAHHSLPSARSFRGVEIGGEYRLINDRYASLRHRRINVTTPVLQL